MQERIALAVHVHGAGAALREPAAEFRIVQADVVAQRVEQRHVRIGIDGVRLAVHVERELLGHGGRPPSMWLLIWNETNPNRGRGGNGSAARHQGRGRFSRVPARSARISFRARSGTRSMTRSNSPAPILRFMDDLCRPMRARSAARPGGPRSGNRGSRRTPRSPLGNTSKRLEMPAGVRIVSLIGRSSGLVAVDRVVDDVATTSAARHRPSARGSHADRRRRAGCPGNVVSATVNVQTSS